MYNTGECQYEMETQVVPLSSLSHLGPIFHSLIVLSRVKKTLKKGSVETVVEVAVQSY